MSNRKVVMKKLMHLSSILQKEVQSLDRAFNQVEPIANELGFTVDRNTGRLIKN